MPKSHPPYPPEFRGRMVELARVGSDPQPLIGTVGSPGTGAVDDPQLPHTTGGGSNPAPFDVSSVAVSQSAVVFVDGASAAGATLTCNGGVSSGFCNDGTVAIDLATKPANGLHLLQVQNPSGLLSNELPWCVGSAGGCTVDPEPTRDHGGAGRGSARASPRGCPAVRSDVPTMPSTGGSP